MDKLSTKALIPNQKTEKALSVYLMIQFFNGLAILGFISGGTLYRKQLWC